MGELVSSCPMTWSNFGVTRVSGGMSARSASSSSYLTCSAAKHAVLLVILNVLLQPCLSLPFPFPSAKMPTTLSEKELNMLHADAVKAGTAGDNNLWFDAIDAKLLDRVITEMNSMNKWFARVVKYWDEFTSGRTGESVYLESKLQEEKNQEAEDEDGNSDGDEETTPSPEGEEASEDNTTDAVEGDEEGEGGMDEMDKEGEEGKVAEEGTEGEEGVEGVEGGEGEEGEDDKNGEEGGEGEVDKEDGEAEEGKEGEEG